MKKIVVALVVLIASPLIANAQTAGPIESRSESMIFVRGLTGPALYSNVDPVDSGWGVGLDLGFRQASGFSLTAKGKFNFDASGYLSTGGGSSYSSTKVRAFFFGIEPGYSVRKGIVTLTLGVGVGAISFKQTLYTSSAGTSSTAESSETRLAVLPGVHADFAIVGGLFASAGVEYLYSFGQKPNPSFFQPVAGVGYEF